MSGGSVELGAGQVTELFARPHARDRVTRDADAIVEPAVAARRLVGDSVARMALKFDFSGDDVIDARGIDWSDIPPPPPGSGVAATDDGRELNTPEEFYEWLAEVRRSRA